MAETFFRHWAELVAFWVMIAGIIIAFISPSAFVSYIIIFLCGLIAGRVLYERKHFFNLPVVIIMLGFLAGFMIGSLKNYGNPIIIVVLFVAGKIVAQKLYEKGVVKDTFV